MTKSADDKLGHAKREIKALRLQVFKLNLELNKLRPRLIEIEAKLSLSFCEWNKALKQEDILEFGHVIDRSGAQKSIMYGNYCKSIFTDFRNVVADA
jgi:hypothetical protein